VDAARWLWEVLRLTELSADQLREWTSRRGLIPPDLPAQKRGNEAKFSWQTILLLRLAVVLRGRFHVELQPHRELLMAARGLLAGASFPALWGKTMAIYDLRRCELLPARSAVDQDEDAIPLRLNRHLQILSQSFGLPDTLSQLPLFPAVAVRSTSAGEAGARLFERGRS
jgi:hypothetical protein